MARLSELERKVNTVAVSTIKECGLQTKPASDGSGLSGFALMNDVFVAAFGCGSSRIGTMSVTNPLVSFSGSWHQDVAHKGFESGPQSLLVGHNQRVFSGIFVDLARKLDSVDLGGVLVAMGLPRSEFETGGSKGYGHLAVDADKGAAHSPGAIDGANKPLPFITA